jgi:hypothetical protein
MATDTGHGKSALAADFCHLYNNSFEFIRWIDCSDPTLIEAKVRRLAERLTNTIIEHDADPAETLREAVAAHRGPWLLVFDGATHRHVIERFVPTHGNGSILVTTVDPTGWWPAAHHLLIETFTRPEAQQCFASYAGLTEQADLESEAIPNILPERRWHCGRVVGGLLRTVGCTRRPDIDSARIQPHCLRGDRARCKAPRRWPLRGNET